MGKSTYDIQRKEGREWRQTFTQDDETEVFKSFAEDLYRKHLLKSSGIARITRKSTCDGSANVTVDYGNGTRRVYTLWF